MMLRGRRHIPWHTGYSEHYRLQPK